MQQLLYYLPNNEDLWDNTYLNNRALKIITTIQGAGLVGSAVTGPYGTGVGVLLLYGVGVSVRTSLGGSKFLNGDVGVGMDVIIGGHVGLTIGNGVGVSAGLIGSVGGL